MVSKTFLVALAATATVTVAAQAQVPEFKSSLDMQIDPKTVTAQTRAQWCSAQTNSCSTLCNSNTDDNSCSPDDLSYKCTCSDKSKPDLSRYVQTMPTLICMELFKQCISQNVGEAINQRACRSNIMDLCGTSEPDKAADETYTTTTASNTESTQAAESASTPTSTSTQKGVAAATMASGQGLAAVAAAVGVLAYLV